MCGKYSCLGTHSFNAKDHEQDSPGRSPGCWLQTRLISPSRSTSDSGFPPEIEVMSCLPVTVARLRRIYTDFPIMPELPCQAPGENARRSITAHSIPITSLCCQIALSKPLLKPTACERIAFCFNDCFQMERKEAFPQCGLLFFWLRQNKRPGLSDHL